MENFLLKKQFKTKRQVGRGIGSSKGGHTAGRGTKGQRSRSGYNAASRMFEGGQMPLYRRLPILKGLHSRAFAKPARAFIKSKQNIIRVKSSLINKFFNDGEIVSVDTLIEKKLIKLKNHKENFIKILFTENLSKKVLIDENIELSAKVKDSLLTLDNTSTSNKVK